MEIKTCFRFEATLNEPIAKNKLRSRIFVIFDRLNIQDEDVLSFSWGKSEAETNLYDKFIIRFVYRNALENMLEFLKNDSHVKEFGIVNYKFEEEENFQMMSNLQRSNSMSSVMTDEILIIPENSHFSTNETSFYYAKPAENDEQPKTNENQLKESESSSTIAPPSNLLTMSMEASAYLAGGGDDAGDTRVEFYSSKNITDEDLSVILLYIENRKASGGGDTISHELDNSRRILTVQYERASAKKRVIDKQVHKFGDFTLNANEPFDKSKLTEPNRLIIILHGITDSVEKSFVQLYTENLVVNDDEENDVESIERSKLLRDVVYVTYKNPIDEAKIRNRVQKRPKLNNCSLLFFPAYKTNIVVVKLPAHENMEANGRDLIELYFSNKKRCGAEAYSSVIMRDPFMYLVYNNENDCASIISREHRIGKYHLKVEYLHNFDLFESGQIKRIEDQEAIPNKQEIKQEVKVEAKKEFVDENDSDSLQKPVMMDTSTSLQYPQPQQPQIVNETKNGSLTRERNEEIISRNEEQEEVRMQSQPETPHLHISIQQEPKLKILKEMPNIWNRFELELSERQSKCEHTEENGSIQIVCTHELPKNSVEYKTMKTKWEVDILKYLSEFFRQLELCQIEIKNRDVYVDLERSIEMDSLQCRMNMIVNASIDVYFVELIGFKDSVSSVRAQIEERIAEPVEDVLSGLTLSQARILLVKRYTRDMKLKFHDLDCLVKAKELCVKYRGKAKEIEEAKQKAREILDAIIAQKLPVDPIVVEFFTKKEDIIVNWLKSLQYQCVVAPNASQSILEIYSTERDHLTAFCKLIRSQLEPLTIDSSLVELVDELKFSKFQNELYSDEEIVFAESESEIKVCGFKDHTDKIYATFLEYLPTDN